MNLSQRLRTCAKHTALDAVIELLNEAADEIERLQRELALRPVQVPMTDDERQSAFLSAPTSSGGHRTAFMLGIQFAEAHHGIKPKEQA